MFRLNKGRDGEPSLRIGLPDAAVDPALRIRIFLSPHSIDRRPSAVGLKAPGHRLRRLLEPPPKYAGNAVYTAIANAKSNVEMPTVLIFSKRTRMNM